MTDVELHRILGFDRRTGALGLDGEIPAGSDVGFFGRTPLSLAESVCDKLTSLPDADQVAAGLVFAGATRSDRASFGGLDIVRALRDLTSAPVGGISVSGFFDRRHDRNRTSINGASFVAFT